MTFISSALSVTRIDLPESVRCPMVILLNQTLAVALDLESQVKFAHWNVKGKEFYASYQLFESAADGIKEASNIIAERIVALGGIAISTVRMVASHSSLPEYPTNLVNSTEHITALIERFAVFAQIVRHGINEAAGWGDAGTADLQIQVSRAIDKQLWLLEAYIQTPPSL